MLQPFVQERGKILSAPHDRNMLAPPAMAGRSHQAGAQTLALLPFATEL